MRYVYKVDTEMQWLEYGHIAVRLDKLIEQKNISRTKLKEATKLDTPVINRLYNGTAQRVDLDVLARLCFALECSVSDIIEYVEPER